jgi:O-succinylbenzoic acid--CoA ligase
MSARLLERARSRARALCEQGVKPGDVVALAATGAPFAEAFHAVDLCGAVLLPLNTRLAPSELRFQLDDVGARLLLHDGSLERLPDAPDLEIAAWGDLPVTSRAPLPAPRPPGAPFVIVFTSGTRGRPRGVVLTRGNLEASARASATHLGVEPHDRWLACMPLFHVGGLSLLVRSALSGIPLVLHERFDAEAVDRALDEDGITLVSLVPTMLQRLLDARGERPAPAALRCVLLGGAAAPGALLDRASQAGFPVAPSYGLTEAASQVATCPLAHVRAPRGVGLAPLPGAELRIEPGSGEILVRGPTVMRGYWRRPQDTERALHGGWLHTGDVGEIDAQGHLHVAGRLDDRILSGGENVDPAEVEAALAAHPGVAEAAVAALPDLEFGQRPGAWIVARGPAPEPEELRRFCRTRLAGYKIPVTFSFVESLPRGPTGKLLRRALRAREERRT